MVTEAHFRVLKTALEEQKRKYGNTAYSGIEGVENFLLDLSFW